MTTSCRDRSDTMRNGFGTGGPIWSLPLPMPVVGSLLTMLLLSTSTATYPAARGTAGWRASPSGPRHGNLGVRCRRRELSPGETGAGGGKGTMPANQVRLDRVACVPSLVLLPAVDVAGGQAVQLVQGVTGTEKRFGDPRAAAQRWQDAGAEWIHLVDLDAAFGRGDNAGIIAEVTASMRLQVEL